MGWFNKKDEEKEKIPQLPELPKLPELPRIREEEDDSQMIHKLPSFPNSQLGQKFSQNTIKEAVTGREEVESAREEDSDDEEFPTTPGRWNTDYSREIDFPFKEDVEKGPREPPKKFKEMTSRIEKKEPLFIRLDKFEDSVNNFERIKNSIIEIEKMLEEVKRIKEKENKELEEWERELTAIKGQIDNIERNVFSKVE